MTCLHNLPDKSLAFTDKRKGDLVAKKSPRRSFPARAFYDYELCEDYLAMIRRSTRTLSPATALTK